MPRSCLPAHVLLSALLGLALLTAPLTTTARAGSAEEGEAIASRWCASCHNIGKGEKTAANDMVPPFDAIARRETFDRVHLQAWLGHPHPPMPNLSLTRSEIDGLVDYIEGLRPPN